MPEPPEIATIRDLVDGLLELARELPLGMDTRLELGVCNGEDLQLVDKCDLDQWSLVSPGKEGSPAEHFVLLRGHVHPGERAGELLRDAASDADQELRKLADDS
jgi:hypothetical protein